MAKLKGFDLDSFGEEAFEPLELNRDVARGKALHMGDVHNLVDALDDLGFYDKAARASRRWLKKVCSRRSRSSRRATD